MCDKTDAFENNPFAYLFPNLAEAKKYSQEAAAKLIKEEINLKRTSPEGETSSSVSDGSNQEVKHSTNPSEKDTGRPLKNKTITKEERISRTAEHVFGITLNKNTDKSLVWSEEFVSVSPDNQLINLSNLEQLLFERLLLEDPSKNLLNPPENGVVDIHVVQTEVITYLIECHKKLNRVAQIKKNDEIKIEIEEMQMLILRNATTALRQPDLYENQDLSSQLLQIFYENQDSSSEEITTFFYGIIDELIKDLKETPDIVKTTFAPVFDFVHKKVANSNMINFEHAVVFSFLRSAASNKHLAEALIDHSTPEFGSPGSRFSDTLLGAIFCLSCLPKVNEGPFEFFDSPTNVHATKTVEDTVWTSLRCINDNLHQLFLMLLKASPEVKHKTLEWLADCLHANAGRGKIGSVEDDQINLDLRGQYVSDGFMLNLIAVLLRLCQPFVTGFDTPKILKIDPTYCVAKITSREEAQRRHCHMHNLHSETCLLPLEEGQERPESESFNFITECYFLAQKSLDLGFRICFDKINKLMQELSKIQRAYNDAVATRGANHEVTEQIQDIIHLDMQRYLSIRAALVEPKTLDLLSKLHATSANWLIQILLNGSDNSSHVLTAMKPLTIPFPEEIPITLKCVPEFILLNLTCFLSFTKRYNRQTFEDNGFEWLDPILSVIIVFMGSSKRISNPHLRAGLAAAMEALLPNNNEDMSMNPEPLGTICRSQLFKQHPLSKLIIPSLLNLFISIEMTGQSVQFQEKFNYRRPMYVIMDHLWTINEHRMCFKNLAVEAERNMEAVTPPLFLRFLNLLINDAVFLLDEALSNMAKLKTMQAARDSGEWAKLPVHERVQNEAYFQEAGIHAEFDNILGRWTIHTLEFLTSEIKSIFWHPVLVDRVAAMLNYFLHHLVGPNKKNFKVKDKDEYNFKPDVFVMDICKIYVHLYESDAFCLAISQDGRSYNTELFCQAQDVLARIGGGALIGELKEVDQKVSLIASRHKLEEEMLPDAPEEFLDPIMSTLMTDPVILPSSRQIVDRTTIASDSVPADRFRRTSDGHRQVPFQSPRTTGREYLRPILPPDLQGERHLLSDESDPFNRSPLTLDKVKSHKELRDRIQNWLSERRKQIQEQLDEKMLSTPSSSKQS